MLRRDAGWSSVWERFVHGGPGLYEPVAAILAPLEPQDLLHADPTVYAAVNARREAELRTALLGMAALDAGAARAAALRLAGEHAPRRSGPWAERGLARLADAAHWLGVLAAVPALPAGNAASLAEAYAATGWQADDAAVRALAAVAPGKGPIETLPADRDAVSAALRALYLPWMQRGAETLQGLLAAGAAPGPAAGGSAPQDGAEPDAVLFVDGLRMDLAHRLAELLRKEGAEVSLTWRWAGFPSVTATCKPLASPAAPRLHGADAAEGFEPLAADGKRVAQPVLLRELAALGWHPPATNTGPGQGASAAGRGAAGRVWAEAGHFDRDGHAQAARMADGVEAGLRAVAAAALGLARGGRRLRVATDHGWLLLPGGLPVAHLPAGLAETVWRRCAVVKPGAPAGALQLPWSWNPAVPVATASGAHVFRAGTEYAHGGISPQESVVPELLVTAEGAAQPVAVQCEWSGLRLRVRAEGGDGLRVALRLGAEGEGASLLDRPRTLDADGRTSLLVADDRLLGEAARLELRDSAGRLVAGQAVRIGG